MDVGGRVPGRPSGLGINCAHRILQHASNYASMIMAPAAVGTAEIRERLPLGMRGGPC